MLTEQLQPKVGTIWCIYAVQLCTRTTYLTIGWRHDQLHYYDILCCLKHHKMFSWWHQWSLCKSADSCARTWRDCSFKIFCYWINSLWKHFWYSVFCWKVYEPVGCFFFQWQIVDSWHCSEVGFCPFRVFVILYQLALVYTLTCKQCWKLAPGCWLLPVRM